MNLYRADAVGNALGDRLAAANTNGSVPGSVSADERSRILRDFADGSNNGSATLRWDMSASPASDLLADLGLGSQVSGGGWSGRGT